jgi:hypothetical protein
MGSKYVAGATIVLAGVLAVASVSVAQTTTGSTIQFHYDTFGNRTTASQPTSTTISDPTLKFVNAPTSYSRTAASSSTTSLTTAITTTVSGGTPPYLFQLTYVSEGSQTPNASRAFASSYGYQPVTTGSGPGAATTPALTTTCTTRPCLYAEHWLMTVTDADGNSITNPFFITHTYN